MRLVRTVAVLAAVLGPPVVGPPAAAAPETPAGVTVIAPAREAAWIWPVRGELVTGYRNGDDPYAAGQHRGIDIAAADGASVVAAAAGTVTFAGTAGRSGLTVAVRTADGRFDTSYLHLSAVTVRAGESVAAGARLGAVGTSGRRSLGEPHLHFGVREAGDRHGYRDPLAFLGPPSGPAGVPALPRAVPAFSPARPSPFPAPVKPPVAAPRALPGAGPATAPALRPVPGPAPRRTATPRVRGVPHTLPALTPAPSPAPAPPPEPRPTPADAHRRDLLPSLGAAPAGKAARHAGAVAGAAAHPGEAGHAGPDVGRILAILGLLAAVGAVSRPANARAARERRRAALGALLRPLAARRWAAAGQGGPAAAGSIARRWPTTSRRRSTT